MMSRILGLALAAAGLVSACGREVAEEGAPLEGTNAMIEARNESAFLDFVASLPEAPEDDYPDCLRGYDWRPLGKATLEDWYGPIPRIEDLVDDTLEVEGFVIPEMRSEIAQQYGALATCAGNNDEHPVILYAPWLLARTGKYSFPFVRYHELAHFEQEHVACPCTPSDPSPEVEMEADCRAAQMLVERYEDRGVWLARAGSDRLRALDPDPTHRSGVERANHVQENCIPTG